MGGPETHLCDTSCICLLDYLDDEDNALWVKSGNRGNLKCLNVNDHYELIFYRKMLISFLSDAKLLHVYD